jgi:DNA-binding protein H-NS
VSSDNYGQLSEEDIQQRLSDLASDQTALEKALERKRQENKKVLAEEIRQMILDRGYELDDVLPYLAARKRGAKKGKPDRAYARYVDPSNPANVYVRGVLPKWMKEQMTAKGLDPKRKEDREAFKEKYLQKLDD